MKKIGLIGSRKRRSAKDYTLCASAVHARFERGDYIVSGGCPVGGDNFAEHIARSLGCSIIIHHANWNEGSSAGYDRNGKIAADIDILIACALPARVGGTEDTIKKFLSMRKLTEKIAIDEGYLTLV